MQILERKKGNALIASRIAGAKEISNILLEKKKQRESFFSLNTEEFLESERKGWNR